ncbi:hypothetical protein N7517_005049 [Penicillium concentricum]|uniref:Uncharacterized protein n=1 Tax=Penicillium concentricum TaxID=293559 RepID=A0A9W9V8Q5_9EURO|nr:uncharacterized protein N7517_005049 [Penicillium concentricum]KAJ5373043.1 hypothetical protein N7517_005049 [Penicillium concentricum]
MASRMDVESSTTNLPKRLSGRFPSGTPLTPTTTKAQDPRLAGTVRQSIDPQSSNTQQAHPILPKKPAFIKRPLTNPHPQVPAQLAPLSIPNSAPGPRSTESQSAPNQQSASFISDLVNSLIKVNKGEEEKERLQKEIASINKNLQRAKQSQQFPSVIALFQQQLDVAKDELANRVKSIVQHRSLSKQAQDNFNSTLSQSKLRPQLENIPERVASLEDTVKGMGQRPEPTAGGESLEIGSVQKDMQGQDIAQLRENLREMQHAINNPNGFAEALDYMKKIANSVGHQSKKIGQFTTQMSQLEDEVKDVDKKLDDRVATVKKMVDTIKEELKISNEQLETNISEAGCKLKTTNEQVQVKLSSIESDLRSLNNKRRDLNNRASTQVSQIETDLEAQRKQATEQITAQENLVASLRTQQQNIDNGGRLSSEGTPTIHNGVLTRVASLENKIQSHADFLNNIKKLHKEVDLLRLSELAVLRQNQESSQATLEARHNETLQKMEDLATKSKQTTKNQTDITAEFHQLRSSLPATLERFRTHLQNGLDRFENRLAPVSDLTRALTKCEGKLETHVTAIRSLEQRYNNITTGDLVDRMAGTMQKMYPSVDLLSRQLTAHRTEVEGRISALKTAADTFKAETETFKADTEMFKADTNQFKADTVKAQADAQNAQASAERSQAAQVSPEQLQTLTQLPTLLQQVKDLSDKLVPIESLLREHSVELQKNLELRSELQNRITVQDDTIGGIAQKADERVEELETLTKSTERIDPLIKEVNVQISQIQEIRQKVDELTQAAESNATTLTDLDDLQRRLKGLEDRKKAEDAALDALRKSLKICEDRSKPDDAGLDALRKQIQDLEDRTATEDNDFGKLQGQLQALEDRRPPVSLEQFNGLREDVNMYIKRLRNAEDTFKALGKEVMDFNAKEATDSDTLDKPMEQRIDGQETPQSQPNGRALTPRPRGTPKTVARGPSLGAYQPMQPDKKGQDDNSIVSGSKSKNSVMQARQPSQIPTGPSSSYPSMFTGKSAEPRQVQNLKGKRRVSSVIDSDEERNTTESSSVVGSLPAPRSSASAPFNQGSSKKEKKRAKKRSEQAEENSKALNRPAKKRKRSKQDE